MRWLAVAAIALVGAGTARGAPASHPAMRPLPVASARPAPAGGRVVHVEPAGSDRGDGSRARPWQTVGHAAARLRPGDTLYLHAGVYFEAVTLAAAGTAAAPITIRAAPGELAVLDGGLRETVEAPATAWQPFAAGAPGEYRSTRSYPALGGRSAQDRGVFVLGNFADSMVPLHGYRLAADLRSANPYWNLGDNLAPGGGIYLGPGVWLDPASHRIHVRLAPTALVSHGAAATYRGEADPRKLALVIGVDRSPLRIAGARHLRIQDLVVRGSAVATVEVEDSQHIELDGLTIYGGSPALLVRATDQLRLVRSSLRGVAAPWSSRASMKYRGASPYLMIADSQGAQSHDWEIARCELTDSHDGIVVDSVDGLRFHHNRLDNFNDDGIYLTLPPRRSLPARIHIHQNLISRTLTALAFAEAGDRSPNAIGPGVHVYRNVFDLREGSYSWPAKDAAADRAPLALAPSKTCGDHGSPTWEPLMFYHNTVINADDVFRSYYGAQMVMGTKASKRRLFNNIFVQLRGNPGLNFPFPNDDLQADGNLMWSLDGGARTREQLAAFRASPAFEASKRGYPPGWTAHDIHADPRFTQLAAGEPALDVSLSARSPAIDAGVAIPAAWPDSLRDRDRGKPDLGALPAGAPMLQVGPSAP